MCQRDHKPEQGKTFGGMQIVICDDIPSGPGLFSGCVAVSSEVIAITGGE